MTREEEIKQAQIAYIGYDWEVDEGCGTSLRRQAFESGARWADSHPSDETIMRILNCIGYEEASWIEFVRKGLEGEDIGEDAKKAPLNIAVPGD